MTVYSFAFDHLLKHALLSVSYSSFIGHDYRHEICSYPVKTCVVVFRFRNDDSKSELSGNKQRGIQMIQLHLIKLIILGLTMAMLSGCIMPPGVGHFPGGGHDNGHNSGSIGNNGHGRN